MHPGGVAEAAARPEYDSYFLVAEGFLDSRGDVEPEAAEAATQTVRLRRGASLTGRVLRDGAPAADVPVAVQAGSSREVAGEDGEALQLFRAYGGERTTRTDADGRFAVRTLTSGWYRVLAQPRGGAPVAHDPVRLRGDDAVDVGDLELVEGAAVLGAVLLPGVAPAGLTVYLDDWQQDVTTITDDAARFRFERLSPGVHTFTLGERPGELASGATVAVELQPGETREVTLDAREMAVCEVALTLELGDLSVNGVQVDLLRADGPREDARLGHCDEEGRVRSFARAWGPAKVRVWLPGSGAVVHPEVLLDLRPGAAIERTVRFEFARLAVDLPAGVALPEDGEVRARFTPAGGSDAAAQHVRARTAAGEFVPDVSARCRVEAGGLSIGGLLPGSWELTFELVDADSELVQVQVGRGVRVEQQAYFSATKEVVLVAGEELLVALD